jgi:glycine dehydrogenase subunit 1
MYTDKIAMNSHLTDLLSEIGIRDVDELFSDIPESIRTETLGLPNGVDEDEVRRVAYSYAAMNRTIEQQHSFLGFGVYNHYVPAVIANIISRNEFITAYTPYQAEISQGMMQALFEYQSMMADLLEMDAVNSSMYDASTALGEAARMASAITGKDELLVPRYIGSYKRAVLENYCKGAGIRIRNIEFNDKGMIDLASLESLLSERTAGVYVEYPNMFGIIDTGVPEVKEIIGNERIFIAGINPISLGVLSPPGRFGADIAIGEGQVLGLGMNFGGPLLGIFATRAEFIRKMPGKIMGLTKDSQGKMAFAMILQTREQHIRREKAVTNMTSNQALMAVATAVYLSLLGDSGLRKIGEINMGRTRQLMEVVREFNVGMPYVDSPVFNEFLIRMKTSRTFISRIARKLNLIPGYILGKEYGFSDRNEVNVVVNVTERNTDEDFNVFREFLREVA